MVGANASAGERVSQHLPNEPRVVLETGHRAVLRELFRAQGREKEVLQILFGHRHRPQRAHFLRRVREGVPVQGGRNRQFGQEHAQEEVAKIYKFAGWEFTKAVSFLEFFSANIDFKKFMSKAHIDYMFDSIDLNQNEYAILIEGTSKRRSCESSSSSATTRTTRKSSCPWSTRPTPTKTT